MQKTFAGNVATFDIGYSGRIQATLCQIVGKPINVFFVHSNGQEANKMQVCMDLKRMSS